MGFVTVLPLKTGTGGVCPDIVLFVFQSVIFVLVLVLVLVIDQELRSFFPSAPFEKCYRCYRSVTALFRLFLHLRLSVPSVFLLLEKLEIRVEVGRHLRLSALIRG